MKKQNRELMCFLYLDIMTGLEQEVTLYDDDFVHLEQDYMFLKKGEKVAFKCFAQYGYLLGSRIGILNTSLFNIELFVFHMRQDKVYIFYYEQYIEE